MLQLILPVLWYWISVQNGMRIIKGERAETGICFQPEATDGRQGGARHAQDSTGVVLCTTDSARALTSSVLRLSKRSRTLQEDSIGCSGWHLILRVLYLN